MDPQETHRLRINGIWDTFFGCLAAIAVAVTILFVFKTWDESKARKIALDNGNSEHYKTEEKTAMDWCWDKGGMVWTFNLDQYNGCLLPRSTMSKKE